MATNISPGQQPPLSMDPIPNLTTPPTTLPPSTIGNPTETPLIEGPAQEPTTTTYPTGTKLYLALLTLALTSFIKSLDVTILAVAVPSLTNDFHTLNDIGWYNASYMMVIAATGFFFGKAYTLFPTRTMYLCSLVVFWVGSVTCTFASNSSIFILGRAIAGLGCIWEAAGFTTLVTALVPEGSRARWIGNLMFVGCVGLVSGPLVGGLLIQRFGWRACFGVNVPAYVFCIGLAWIGVPVGERMGREDLTLMGKIKELDLTGSLVFTPAFVCLFVALSWGGTTYSWSDSQVVVLFVVTGILLVVFAGLQWYLDERASIPPRILKQRSILAVTLFSFCCNGALVVTENYISIYFQGVRGLSPSQSALLGVPMIAGLMSASLIAGHGATWIGYYNPFLLSTSLLAPIASGCLTLINLDNQLAMAAGLLGLLGFGIGLGLNVPMMVVSSILKPEEVSIGTAIVAFGGSMGSAIFSSAAAALFQNRLGVEIADAAPGTNVTSIENAGLADIRAIVGEDKLGAVLRGYDEAVVQTLYMPVALSVLTIAGSVLVEWRSVKKKSE